MRKLLLLLLAALLLGCSITGFDKKTATQMLGYRLGLGTRGLVVSIGRVGSNCRYGDGRVGNDLTPSKDIVTITAQRAGLVTVKPDGPHYWKVELTDKGKPLSNLERMRSHFVRNTANGCNFEPAAFDIATSQLVSVDSVKGMLPVTVEYEWKWRVTPLGASLRQDGELYAKLNDEERHSLQKAIGGLLEILTIPVPPEGTIQRGTTTFSISRGKWRETF